MLPKSKSSKETETTNSSTKSPRPSLKTVEKDDKKRNTKKKAKLRQTKKSKEELDEEADDVSHESIEEQEGALGPEEAAQVSPEELKKLLHEFIPGDSPIDLSLDYPNFVPILMNPIVWNNMNTAPTSLMITNAGYSLVVTGRWLESEMPYLKGGPLLDEYVFTQLHYHWGHLVQERCRGRLKRVWVVPGSDHTVDSEKYPFEVHAVFRKRSCETHEEAKRIKDGLIIMVYMCADIQEIDNPYIEPITKKICGVFEAFTSRAIDNVPLSAIIPTFSEDYLLYMGYMKYKCGHGILWMISRNSFPISLFQLCEFQCLMNKFARPISNPYRDVQPHNFRPVFHVNPSSDVRTLIHALEEDVEVMEEPVMHERRKAKLNKEILEELVKKIENPLEKEEEIE